MTSWEPDPRWLQDQPESEGEWVDVNGVTWWHGTIPGLGVVDVEQTPTFSRGTYWGVACFIVAALFLAGLLYMGRPW